MMFCKFYKKCLVRIFLGLNQRCQIQCFSTVLVHLEVGSVAVRTAVHLGGWWINGGFVSGFENFLFRP